MTRAGHGTWRDAVRLAVGTLTVVRVPPPSRVDPRVAARAMLLAPGVALVPAAAAVAASLVADLLGLGPPLVAAAAVGAAALASRGLHLDGLADTADGLAASYDRARALAVMRRGDLGPAGGATLVLVLLGQVGCLAQLDAAPAGGPPWVALVTAAVAGRTTLPVLCVRGIPAAREAGLGSAVVGTVPRVPAVGVGLVVTAGLTLLAGPAGALATLAALVAAGAVARRCVHRLGGLTGDVLGAGVEIGSLAALLALASLAPS